MLPDERLCAFVLPCSDSTESISVPMGVATPSIELAEQQDEDVSFPRVAEHEVSFSPVAEAVSGATIVKRRNGLYLAMTRPNCQDLTLTECLGVEGNSIGNTQFRRDEARCLATQEAFPGLRISTVSLHDGCPNKHLKANFGSRNFIEMLSDQFPETIASGGFDHAVLDWFWMPAGWSSGSHGGLFSRNICSISDVLTSDAKVHLPLNVSTFVHVAVNIDDINECYDIKFLSERHAMRETPLYAGTNRIPEHDMATTLDRADNQVKEYLGGMTKEKLAKCVPQTHADVVQDVFSELQNEVQNGLSEAVFLCLVRKAQTPV